MRTFADLVDRLRVYVGNDVSPQKSVAVHRAAYEAVRSISSKHDWLYYRTYGRLRTNAPYEDGTVQYVHSGGSVPCELILTGGTWPTWAGQGIVWINGIPHDAQRRVSNTILQLAESTSPGADLPSGTAYRLDRVLYPLPDNFQAIQKPVIADHNTQLQKTTVENILYNQSKATGPALPSLFSIIDKNGIKQLWLEPPPDQVYTIIYEYKRHPKEPKIYTETTGKIAMTNNSTTVTGTQTMFIKAHEGCVLRVSQDTEPPTANDGLHPFASEHIIEEYISPTQIIIQEPATETVSNRAYSISSILDVDDGDMFDYLVQIGMKNLRIALRINMTNEELAEYRMVEERAKSADAQRYAGHDNTLDNVAYVRKRSLSYMRPTSF